MTNTKPSPETKSTGQEILIVEDDLIIARHLQGILTRSGYLPSTVASGEEAIQQVVESSPDLILMDINLAGEMDGIETAEQIRSRFDIPVVYLTAYADKATLQRVKMTEPYSFLVKPVREKELLAAIEMSFYKHRMESKLKQYHNHLEELVAERTAELTAINKQLQQEIAERKRAEAGQSKALAKALQATHALQESESRYRVLVETMNDGLGTVSKEGVITFVNDSLCEMLGYSRQELIDRLVTDLLDETNQSILKEQMGRRVESKPEPYELEWLRKDGERIVTIVSPQAMFDREGNFTGSFGVITDITGRKQTEETRIRRTQEMEALYKTSLEINTHLDVTTLLQAIVRRAAKLLRVGMGELFLLNPDGETLELAVVYNQSDTRLGTTLHLGEGVSGRVARTGKSMMVADYRNWAGKVSSLDHSSVGRMLGVPLKQGDQMRGVLNVLDEKTGTFGDEEIRLLSMFAAQAAVAIENAQLYQQAQQEIAGRQRIASALQESERRLRTLSAATFEGIVITDQGVVIDANPQLAGILGYEMSELLGMDTGEFVTPEDRELVRGNISAGIEEPYEHRALRKDGSTIFVEVRPRMMSIQDRPVRVTAVRDITERKQAEETLRQRNEELMALNAVAMMISQSLNLNHILEMVLEVVLRTIDVEAGWIELFERDDDSPLPVTQSGFTDDINEAVKLSQGITRQVIQLGETIVVDKGSDIPWSDMETGRSEALPTFAGVPIKGKEKVLGVLNIFSRRSRRLSAQTVHLLTAIGYQIGVAVENARLVEEAAEIKILQELDRLRSELIANVSHELRTPLGLIKVFCTILLGEDVTLDRETQLECLHNIDEETDKLEEIVNNLLDISRLEGGRLYLNKQPTDLSQLVIEVTEVMEIQLTDHHFVFDFPAQPLIASLDAERIERVLRNLLTNAVKYSPEGGQIIIRGEMEQERVRIAVSDQGLGIDAENKERIFERFYRVEHATTRNIRGVGLGLAICRGIIEAHGGRIWAENNLGAGSTFYFTIPVGKGAEVW